MKISVNWLKNYVDIHHIDDLLDKLTLAGTEVDSVQHQGNWEGVVVAEIRKINKHPNADRLSLVEIVYKDNVIKVVCGANNLYENQKVAFAPVGSKLYNPKSGKMETLKKSKIRGEISNGMICSALELGLGEDHDGILDLEGNLRIGIDLKEIFNDTIINLELTPNRPDCLGVYGVAREISAITGTDLKSLKSFSINEQTNPKHDLNISIEDPDLCSRYIGAVISGIKIQESPKWLKDTLVSIGENPINNIVDITNYVMFELGQPLHAFDYEKVNDKTIVVRRAKKGEKIVTLDGDSHNLKEEMLVIADSKVPMAVAGIKGGLESGINEKTSLIVLESACFEGGNNRNTASELELKSQATLRFEKNLKPQLCEVAFNRAIHLIRDITGGEISSRVVDVKKFAQNDEKLRLHRSRLESVLGIKIESNQVNSIFNGLGFEYKHSSKNENDVWDVDLPYWRPDITIQEDLCEEIARLIGYESIPATTISGTIPTSIPNIEIDFQEHLRDIMVSLGCFEVINYSADSKENIASTMPSFNEEDLVKIMNPMSRDVEFMKPTLRSGILKSLSLNSRNSVGSVKLFELGTIFAKKNNEELPNESKILCCGLSGTIEKTVWEKERPVDIFDLKSILDNLFSELRISYSISPCRGDIFSSYKGFQILLNEDVIGTFGEVSDEIINLFDINHQNVILLDLDIKKILSNYLPTSQVKYNQISRYPVSKRDLSFIVDDAIFSESIIVEIEKFDLVKTCKIVDVYVGKSLKNSEKSVTVRITYGSDKKTLSGPEIDQCEKNILESLKSQINFSLRV